MPRIPQYQGGGINLPNVSMDAGAEAANAGARLGQSIAGLGRQVMDTGFAFQAEEQRRQADQLVVKAQADFFDFRDGLDQRTDYQGFQADYTKFVSKWTSENAGGLSEFQKKDIGARLDTLKANVGRSVKQRSREVQIDQSRAQLLSETDAASRAYMLTENDDERREVEDNILASIEGRIATGVLTAEAGQKIADAFLSDAQTGYAAALLEQNPAALARQLKDADFLPDIDPVQRMKLAEKAEAEVEKIAEKAATDIAVDRVLSAYDAGGMEAATAEIDKLATDKSAIPDNAKRLRAINQASALLRAADAQEADKRAKVVADLSLGVSRGTKDHADIDAAYKSGDITPAQHTALLIDADKAVAERGKNASLVALGASFFSGAAVMDPSNPEHRKAAEGHFGALLNEWRNGDPEQVGPSIVDYVKRTAYVPEVLRNILTGGLRSETNDDLVFQNAQMVDRLTDASPIAVEALPSDVMERAALVNQAVLAGEDPRVAVSNMRERLNPKNKALRDMAEAEIKEGKFEKDYQKWVLDAFDEEWLGETDFGGDRMAQAKMRQDFKFLFEDIYARTGDTDVARAVAAKKMNAKWGVTDAEGKARLIEYPPEKVYAQALGFVKDIDSVIRDDLEAMVRSTGHEGDYQLVSDAKTREGAKNGRPSYGVMLMNADGVFVPALTESGRPARWGLDVDKVRAEWEAGNDMPPPERNRTGQMGRKPDRPEYVSPKDEARVEAAKATAMANERAAGVEEIKASQRGMFSALEREQQKIIDGKPDIPKPPAISRERARKGNR